MSTETIARRYAIALADVVLKQGNAREVQSELQAWEEMMTANPLLLEVFRNPTISYLDKRRVLDALIARARPMQTTANVLQVLLQNARLADLEAVNLAFARVLDERAGMITAHVTTARSISTQIQDSLRQRLAEIAKKGINLNFHVDESIIGGVITQIGSTVYDGSVRNELQQAKAQMLGEVA